MCVGPGWTLYYNFNLTHVRLQQHESSRAIDSDGGGRENFFLTHRHLTSSPFLLKVNLAVFGVLMLAPLILTTTRPSIADAYGDGCDQGWGPPVLAAYVALYVCVFLWFGFSLRSVVDGFKIKIELKVTGFIALVAVVPWYVFNQAAGQVNRDVFPFSTLFLLIAIVAAFTASTIFPLYWSLFNNAGAASGGRQSIAGLVGSAPPGSTNFHNLVPGSPSSGGAGGGPLETDRLYKILAHAAGALAFKQFLTKEFSVENIVFYDDVEHLRASIRSARASGVPEELVRLKFALEARKLHAKYISLGAPYQVNLPDPVVKNCEAHLRFECLQAGAPPPLPGQLDGPVVGRAGRGASVASGPGGAAAAAAAAAAAGVPASSSFTGGGAGGGLGPSAIQLEEWGAPPPPQSPPMDHLDRTTPTLFDDSQRTIYILMEKDSMLRFVRSDLYKKWVDGVAEEERRKRVLAEMDLA